jgi:methylmalonyl-CoA mutase
MLWCGRSRVSRSSSDPPLPAVGTRSIKPAMASDPALFPDTTEDDWRRAAGRQPPPFVTEDGVTIAPLQAARNNAAPIAIAGGWRVIQRLTSVSAEAALREASSAIAGGVNGIEVVFEGSAHPLSSQLPHDAAKRLAAGLRDFGVPDITFRIDAGRLTSQTAMPFAELARSTDAALVLAYDPVAHFAATTDPGWPRLERGPEVAQALASVTRIEGAAVVATADGRIWHAAGATEVQELAAVLATFVAIVRAGASPAHVAVALAADTQLIPTIAKFRAMRLLLGRLAEIVAAPAIVPIHAETAWRSRTRVEPRMNVLRATVAAAGAVAGGADSLTVLPHDAGTPDSQRLARNTQLIPGLEASLARVADPGAGAGAIEALTDAFAAQAWTSFQAIEAEGGISAPSALERLSQSVSAMRQKRAQRVASGELPFVGVNVHVAEGTDFGAGIVDYPSTLLRYEALDGEFIEMQGGDA